MINVVPFNSIFLLVIQSISTEFFVLRKKESPFADHWQYAGIAASEPGYHIWGNSPILGDIGIIHLCIACWPSEYRVDPGWRSHSKIAHYVGGETTVIYVLKFNP